MSSPTLPPGFARIHLRPAGFLETNGPFYGRRDGSGMVVGLRIERRHCNSVGVAHGGLILAFLDVVLTVGTNVEANLSRFLVTMNVTCDFLSPAPLHTWIEGRAEVLQTGSRHVFSRVLIRSESASPVARGSGILLVKGDVDAAYAPDLYFQSLPNPKQESP